MDILISELESFINEDNRGVVEELINVLMENNIDTYRELADLEESYFDKNMSLLDRISLSYKQMIKDIYKYDNMQVDEIRDLDKMKEEFNNSNDGEEKLILIIKIYNLLGYQMIFPFCCYKMIYERKI